MSDGKEEAVGRQCDRESWSFYSRRKKKKKKKTPDLLDLCNCHSCGERFKGRSEDLRLLDSHWRFSLLCNACFRAVGFAEACSYCFEDFGGNDENPVHCCNCSRRVHLRCLPLQRGYLLRSDLLPDFLCIDCCPFLRKPRVCAENATSRDLFRVFEEEIARQLDPDFDGSRRIRNNFCIGNSARSNDLEKEQSAVADLPREEPELRICEKEELAAADQNTEVEIAKAEMPRKNLPAYFPRSEGESSIVSLPDRYTKKYFKRSPGIKKER